jgi:hypothetical protein
MEYVAGGVLSADWEELVPDLGTLSWGLEEDYGGRTLDFPRECSNVGGI